MSNITKKKILRLLDTSDDDAFVRREFAPFGSGMQVARALRQLIEQGRLVRAGQGIWVKSVRMTSPFKSNYGEVVTVAQTSATGAAMQVLPKLGYKVSYSKLKLDQLEKRSTQVPISSMIRILNKKRERTIVVNKQKVEYEKD